MGVVSINPKIQGGVPCFSGSRVPISSLFDHLKKGYTVDEFLADFPTVSKAQAEALLDLAEADIPNMLSQWLSNEDPGRRESSASTETGSCRT